MEVSHEPGRPMLSASSGPRGSYCWTEVCLSAAHISHGRIFGFEENSPNKGLNFLYLEYRFK